MADLPNIEINPPMKQDSNLQSVNTFTYKPKKLDFGEEASPMKSARHQEMDKLFMSVNTENMMIQEV